MGQGLTPDFLTIEDTMALWRWGPRFMRLGDEKTVRYDPPDVDEWLEAQKVSSTSEEVAAGRRFHEVKSRTESSTKPMKATKPARRIEAQP